MGKAASKYTLSGLQKRLLRPSLGQGVSVAEGVEWRQQRRLAVRLSGARAPSGASAARASLADTVHGWVSKNAACASMDVLTAFALDEIALHQFGVAGIATAERLAALRNHRCLLDQIDLLDLVGAPEGMRSARMRRSARLARSIDGVIIRTARQTLARRGPNVTDLDDERLRDLIVSLLSGYEPVSLTAFWALKLLAENPAHIEAVRRAPLPDPNDAKKPGATKSALDCLLAESVRLYPPLPFLLRESLEDDDTPAGPIKRGSLVCAPLHAVHRHRTLWQNPDGFDPDRFAHGSGAGFMPFGVGTRRCPGHSLGMLIAGRAVWTILAHATPYIEGPVPTPRGGLSLRPRHAESLRFGPVQP